MKKYHIVATTVAFALTGIASGIAYAETTTATTTTVPATVSVPTTGGPVMINIDPNGHAMLRGEVVSTGADFIVVKSWGTNLKVKVWASTHIVSKNSSLSDFKAGDIVGVLGNVSEDGSFIINADTVREWGQRLDNDKDGIPDVQDKDDDNDGILDVNEPGKSLDHDNDGIADSQDPDDDNDGILDSNESGFENDHGGDQCIVGEQVLKAYDHDNDGVADSEDHDDKGKNDDGHGGN